MLLVPTGQAPHKPIDPEPGAGHRVAMAECAVADDPALEVSTIETERPGPSYMHDTLAELADRHRDQELLLIVGADQAAGFGSWHRARDVAALAPIAVARRLGYPDAQADEALAELGADTRWFTMPAVDVSSSEVRRRRAAGRPIRYLVPDTVRSYIEREGLYL